MTSQTLYYDVTVHDYVRGVARYGRISFVETDSNFRQVSLVVTCVILKPVLRKTGETYSWYGFDSFATPTTCGLVQISCQLARRSTVNFLKSCSIDTTVRFHCLLAVLNETVSCEWNAASI